MTNSSFEEKFPDFWDVVKPQMFGPGPLEMDYNEEKFDEICKIIIEYIAYFSIGDIMTIDAYLEDLIASLSGVDDDGFHKVIRFCLSIDDFIQEKKNQNRELVEYLKPRINKRHLRKEKDKEFIYNPMVKRKQKRKLYRDEYYESDDDDGATIKVLNDLKLETKIQFYYLLIYVNDLTIKLQQIKSELIKYELSRIKSKNYTLSPLDVIINELLLQYQEINREFIEYNTKLSQVRYKYDNDLDECWKSVPLWPRNIYLMEEYRIK